jgi:hypothetical protein
MPKSIDLELSLHHRHAGPYTAELRSSWPDSDVDPLSGKGRVVQFDFDELRAVEAQPADYGELLARCLFTDQELYADFTRARTAAQTQQYALRVQLLIGTSAPELHQLHWETLRDPQDHTPLFNGENILFSRYLLGSSDWRPVRPRSKGELRALIAVANPSGLDRYEGLAPVDVAGEIARARQGLGAIAATSLLDFGTQHSSLDNLIACLRQEHYDIIYLVCHGSFGKDESYLWLEDDAGQVKRTSGQELVNEIRGLAQRPLLMVLAACESASASGSQALSSVGPRLAVAGVPAVIAMQGQISMATVAKFMPTFFAALQREGHIDRAMAVARGAVSEQPDHWMPVLFTRLKSGRIWYVPGFRGGDFDKWPTLLNSIKKGKCTPILGMGLTEPLVGSMREIALDWADKYGFPMAPHERESLPQVAQFVAVNQDPKFLRDQLGEYLRHEMRERYAADLPPELQKSQATLDQLIEAVYAARWSRDQDEAHRLLAQLPLPIYITANVNNLLAKALKEIGKDPQVVICPWYKQKREPDAAEDEDEEEGRRTTIFDRERTLYRTTPLVYHLFGRLGNDQSLVLTEDEYFDYLISVSRNWQLIPKRVLQKLANSALLFLGFQMDDWSLRTFLRLITVRQEGGRRRDQYTHISAQIEPEEGRLLKPERAQKYLEDYFKGRYINVYWGSTAEFLKELQRRWNEQAG